MSYAGNSAPIRRGFTIDHIGGIRGPMPEVASPQKLAFAEMRAAGMGGLLSDWISLREDAVIYRTGLSNQADPRALGSRDKSNNFAHICSKHQLDNEFAIR